MQTPQDGIFGRLSENHYSLEYRFRSAVRAREVVSALRKITRLPGKGGPVLVIGFGSRLWKRLAPLAVPRLLRPFSTIKGRREKYAPGTQQDLWLWLHGGTAGELFDLAMQTQGVLGPYANLFQQVPGMTYRGGRDLTGFADGTANPNGAEAKKVALIAKGEKGEGGSYILAMRWVHDMKAFAALPPRSQEAVIGRTKEKDVELKGAAKRPNAHISRMEIEVDGKELQIYRRSTPYGTLTEMGLYFLAFSADPTRFSMMLNNMYGLGEGRLEDRLTDYTRAVSGSYFFVPSKESLRDLLG